GSARSASTRRDAILERNGTWELLVKDDRSTMARSDIKNLYQELRSTRFSFIPRGEHHLHDVYRAVKLQYPSLCDDTFSCAQNCARGNELPEWHHVVRRALQSEKGSSSHVERGSKKVHWRFK